MLENADQNNSEYGHFLYSAESFNKDLHKTKLNLVKIDEITGNHFDNMANFNDDNSIARNF